MTDERPSRDLSDIAETELAKPSSRFERGRKMLSRMAMPLALAGSVAAVYYGWFVPESNLLQDYKFCMEKDIQSYRDVVIGNPIQPISRLHGSQTGYSCLEIYRLMSRAEESQQIEDHNEEYWRIVQGEE